MSIPCGFETPQVWVVSHPATELSRIPSIGGTWKLRSRLRSSGASPESATSKIGATEVNRLRIETLKDQRSQH